MVFLAKKKKKPWKYFYFSFENIFILEISLNSLNYILVPQAKNLWIRGYLMSNLDT